MILSFHPCFESDVNRLCAGRLPDDSDRDAIQSAEAVILPQGCRPELYTLATRHCRHVFPDYHARFAYPGKIGQIRLFKEIGVPHPKTLTFTSAQQYHQDNPSPNAIPFPLVFKFNWGGEGETVSLINTKEELDAHIARAEQFEKNNQTGFLIQEYIPSGSAVLRVVVIGTCLQSYWRVQDRPATFAANLSTGGRIDHKKDPDLQQAARHAVKQFCDQTRINLAGFDIIFSTADEEKTPYFLEINYFFGRKGIGGSEIYYQILNKEIRAWIASLP